MKSVLLFKTVLKSSRSNLAEQHCHIIFQASLESAEEQELGKKNFLLKGDALDLHLNKQNAAFKVHVS